MERPHSRRRFLRASGVALTVGVAGCTEAGENEGAEGGAGDDAGQSPDGAAAVVTVGPDGRSAYDPDEIEVEQGQTVRWVWASDEHTVSPVSAPEGADWEGVTEPHDQGHVYEHSFESTGPYEYECDVHTDGSLGLVHVRQRANPASDGENVQ